MKKVKFISEFFTTDFQDCDEELYNKLKGLEKIKMKFNLNGMDFEELCSFEFKE